MLIQSTTPHRSLNDAMITRPSWLWSDKVYPIVGNFRYILGILENLLLHVSRVTLSSPSPKSQLTYTSRIWRGGNGKTSWFEGEDSRILRGRHPNLGGGKESSCINSIFTFFRDGVSGVQPEKFLALGLSVYTQYSWLCICLWYPYLRSYYRIIIDIYLDVVK